MNHSAYLLIGVLLLSSCQSEPVRSSYQTTNAISSGIPNHTMLRAGYFPEIGAQTLTKKTYDQMNSGFYCMCSGPSTHFHYCGSNGAYHYLQYTHLLGTKHLKRILKTELSIENEFPVTTESSAWRKIPPAFDWINFNSAGNLQLLGQPGENYAFAGNITTGNILFINGGNLQWLEL